LSEPWKPLIHSSSTITDMLTVLFRKKYFFLIVPPSSLVLLLPAGSFITTADTSSNPFQTTNNTTGPSKSIPPLYIFTHPPGSEFFWDCLTFKVNTIHCPETNQCRTTSQRNEELVYTTAEAFLHLINIHKSHTF
jgi:hypothetical protein